MEWNRRWRKIHKNIIGNSTQPNLVMRSKKSRQCIRVITSIDKQIKEFMKALPSYNRKSNLGGYYPDSTTYNPDSQWNQ